MMAALLRVRKKEGGRGRGELCWPAGVIRGARKISKKALRVSAPSVVYLSKGSATCVRQQYGSIENRSVTLVLQRATSIEQAEIEEPEIEHRITFVMRNLCAAGLMALMAATPAFAGDAPAKELPTKAPAAAAFSWTGCYMGVHIGGALSQDTLTANSGRSADFNSDGFIGGGQIGCDYQFADRWVVGGEGRVAGNTMKTSNAGTVRTAAGDILSSRLTFENDVLASITARIGYRIADRWLGYVKGGAAVTHETSDVAFTTTDGLARDPKGYQTRTGWTVGGGFDWAFAPNWSANIEYNYYDFGSQQLTATSVTPGVELIAGEGSVKDTIHAVSAGVNYHF